MVVHVTNRVTPPGSECNPSTRLVVGAKVKVRGLTSEAGKGFNGRVGTLVRDTSAYKRQRLRVKLDKLEPPPDGEEKEEGGRGGAVQVEFSFPIA
jgi:hypothetical protein